MQIDITQLQRMGLQANNPLIKKTITIQYFPLKEGSETERESERVEGQLDFWIRKFTASDRIATSQLAREGGPEEATLLAVQRSIFMEDGKPVFPDVESVRGLDLEMFAPLLVAINEINGDLTKKIRPKTNSGGKSLSPSVGARRGNGKKSSRNPKSSALSNTETNSAP